MRHRTLLLSVVCALVLAAVPGLASAATPGPVDEQNVTWLDHVDTPSAVTGLAFIRYPGGRAGDVMFGDGPFGLRAWSLADPTHPALLNELPASALARPGDDVSKGFWEGEHLQVDPVRRLVFVIRDPRAFGGNKQTGTSGLYIVDARDPRHLRLITFHEEPGGHTSQCIAHCRYLWRRPHAHRNGQSAPGLAGATGVGHRCDRPRAPLHLPDTG